MLCSKNLAILNASCSEALYLPFSREMMVCLVTPRADASSSWVTLFCFRSSCILVFNHIPPCLTVILCFVNVNHALHF